MVPYGTMILVFQVVFEIPWYHGTRVLEYLYHGTNGTIWYPSTYSSTYQWYSVPTPTTATGHQNMRLEFFVRFLTHSQMRRELHFKRSKCGSWWAWLWAWWAFYVAWARPRLQYVHVYAHLCPCCTWVLVFQVVFEIMLYLYTCTVRTYVPWYYTCTNITLSQNNLKRTYSEYRGTY